MLTVRSKQAAKATAQGIQAIGKKLATLLKTTATAVKSLTVAFAAGGTTAVLVVLFICLIAMVAGSFFGIFFAAQPTGSGAALQSVVQQLTDDYYAQIREIEESVPHDRLKYAPDGLTAIRWEDVLPVIATDMAAADNGQPVAVLETAQINRLKEILWAMNPVSYRTYTEEHEEERTTIDEEDNEVTETITVTETVLEITILHSTPQDTASVLGFTNRRQEQLGLLADPQYDPLWMELLGGYVSGGGQIMAPGAGPSGTGSSNGHCRMPILLPPTLAGVPIRSPARVISTTAPTLQPKPVLPSSRRQTAQSRLPMARIRGAAAMGTTLR